MTGNIAHHSARSLMFPQPAPGAAPKKGPLPWDPNSSGTTDARVAFGRHEGRLGADHRDSLPVRHFALLAVAGLAACAGQASPPAAPVPVAMLAPPSTPVSSTPPSAAAPACSHAVPAGCNGGVADLGDAMPIFKKRCFGCHTGDGVAVEEEDFSKVEALRAARSTIADEDQDVLDASEVAPR